MLVLVLVLVLVLCSRVFSPCVVYATRTHTSIYVRTLTLFRSRPQHRLGGGGSVAPLTKDGKLDIEAMEDEIEEQVKEKNKLRKKLKRAQRDDESGGEEEGKGEGDEKKGAKKPITLLGPTKRTKDAAAGKTSRAKDGPSFLFRVHGQTLLFPRRGSDVVLPLNLCLSPCVLSALRWCMCVFVPLGWGGSAYASQRAGGDSKRKGQKFDPFAYIPLDPTALNKRKRANSARKYDALFSSGAGAGAGKRKGGAGGGDAEEGDASRRGQKLSRAQRQAIKRHGAGARRVKPGKN